MIYDTSTKNMSFLEISEKLKELKIKNNKFMLELNNKKLQNIDPRNPNLSNEDKRDIILECTNNIWYFLREIVLIPLDDENRKVALNLGTCAYIFCKLNKLNTFLILPRQHGKTVIELLFELWLMLFKNNHSMVMLNKDKPSELLGVKIIKDIINTLPAWMINFISDKKDRYLQNSIYLHSSESSITALIPSIYSFIGNASSHYLLDEFAFMKDNEDILDVVKAHNSIIPEDKNYGISISTTPNLLVTNEANYAKSYKDSSLKWETKFFNYDCAKLKKLIENNETNNFICIEYSYSDLGRSEAWLELNRKLFPDENMLRREVLLEWV